ncbi:hypothetical protein EVAR_52191_1 [Eumeta japonica]|uniref:Tc1-like transposase DDE domain-containing protein n=1 Tax=Eumeta variegata TaxID=151549 RepID=A0A4C1Z2Q5_EUMVA|nr:hypothetical protein EVAR_52191_1 [Eumeta japonica]
MAEQNHTILRLPPYHPDLNPIEMAWSTIKQYVGSKNVKWNINNAIELIIEKVNLMGAPEWEVLGDKVKRIEEEYAKSDHVVDLMTEEFIIRVGDDVDDDEDSSDSDDSEDIDGESSNDDDEVMPSTYQRTGIQLQHQHQQHALHFSTSQDEVPSASSSGIQHRPVSISQDDLMEVTRCVPSNRRYFAAAGGDARVCDLVSIKSIAGMHMSARLTTGRAALVV